MVISVPIDARTQAITAPARTAPFHRQILGTPTIEITPIAEMPPKT